MKKKISFMIFLLFFLFGTSAFAHSHLEDSTPKQGEILTQSPKDFILTFETNVEQTSTFFITDRNGTEIPHLNVKIDGNKLVGTKGDALTNGAYDIHWKVIGTDGHPLEGNIPFTVQLQGSQSTTAPSNSSTKETKAAVVKKANKESATPAKLKQSDPMVRNLIVPISVGLFLVVGAASYWLFYRRKQV
ncbi:MULTISPECIES: copper resistance CopC family protein [Bacillaceae]|uniref:copper resistance CopC family protein n=1 Tax=Bacillaceae TaxID=186817 RepID=UPI002FFE8121